jgi:hypothetical protein
MAEQVIQVVSNMVKFNGNVARVSSTVIAANPEAGVRTDSFIQVVSQASDKTLTERFNEVYNEDARREDEEFFRSTKAYYRRRSNSGD